MIENLNPFLLPLFLAATPLSLIILKQLTRVFSKYTIKMGNTTTICTNVTGTLTDDKLIVSSLHFDEYEISAHKDPKFLKVNEMVVEKPQLQTNSTLKSIALTTNLCHFPKMAKIEKVIVSFLQECGFNKSTFEAEYQIIDSIELTEKKKLSTIVALHKETSEIYAFSKGNPGDLLQKCTKIMIGDKKIELTHQDRRKLRKKFQSLNKNGQKVIGYAIKPLPKKRQHKYTENFAENDMTFLGIIGLWNPIKETLQEGISFIKDAGIKTYLVTSIKEINAIAIGKKLNIINPQYFESFTGDYLRKLTDQKIDKMFNNKEKDLVFAELNEEDKKRLITLLKKHGETITIVNKKEKIGLNEATEGIKKGRIFALNYEKFAPHAMSVKIAQFGLMIFALFLKAPLPLTIALIIGLDLIVNFFIELSLKLEHQSKQKITEHYVPPDKSHIPATIIRGLATGAIVSAIYLLNLVRYGWRPGETLDPTSTAYIKSITITFLLLGVIQIINGFNMRESKKSILKTSLLQNPYLLLASIISILGLYIVQIIPEIRDYLGLATLSLLEWEILAFAAFITLLIEETRKYISRNGIQTSE